MARLVIATLPHWEDVAPSLPVARRLVERGHLVRYVVAGTAASRVRAAGFEVQAADWTSAVSPADAEAGLQDSYPATTRWNAILQAASLPQAAAAFTQLDRWTEDADAILATPWQLAGRLVAGKRGLPNVRLAARAADLPAAAGAGLDDAAYDAWMRGFDGGLNRLNDYLGLPQREGVLRELLLADLSLLLTSELIEPRPIAPAVTLTGLCRLDSGAAPAEVAAFLAEPGRPCLCSFPLPVPRRNTIVEIAARALQEIDRRGLVLTEIDALAAQLKVASSRLAVATGVEASAVVEACSAVIHSPDFESCRTALLAGLPSLALPFTSEQRVWAERLEALGVGISLPAAATSDVVADRLRRLLEQPTYSERAAELAHRLSSEDGAQRACLEIERLLEGR